MPEAEFNERLDHEIIELLKKAIYEISLKEPGDINATTKISEFGLDSVAIMELIGLLEENLSIRVEDAEVASLQTVGDLLTLIRNRMEGSTPNPAPEVLQSWDECCDITALPEIRGLERRIADLGNAKLGNPYFHVHDGTAGSSSVIGGVRMLNFSSYNYLGFCGHPEVNQAAKEAIDRYGTSVSASRLVSGERRLHLDLESGISRHIGVEDAVVFVSGHATNVTTIGHLFDKNDLIIHDALCHDSILQGIYLSGAKRRSFRHSDTADLEAILKRSRGNYRRVLICSEGLFSMDGDICDLPSMIELKKRFRCYLMIDEAHSIGVLGHAGRGVAHHFTGTDPRDVDLWMGTLSKSFASCGGYIAGRKELIRYLKYTAPGFLYSVGMPPPNAAAALKSLELMQRHPEIVERLRRRSRLFLELARSSGVDTGLAMGAAVIPAIIGDSVRCMQISSALAARKINVQPIVHPAVEENAARLRFFISANHTEDEIRYTVQALSEALNS